jgi:hypothetical protein
MYKLILLIFILGIFLYQRQTIEGSGVRSCCGGIVSDENRTRAPKRIRRCLKDEVWEMPCTNKGSTDCCAGEDRCIPSRHGGKCQKKDGSGHYIYDEAEKKDYVRSRDDTDDDDGDDESNIDTQELYDKLFNLDYLNYFIIFCICVFILYLIYHLFIEKNVNHSSQHSSQHSSNSHSHHKPSDSRYSGHNKEKSWRR